MNSYSQIATRRILLRVGIFVLTATIAQGVVDHLQTIRNGECGYSATEDIAQPVSYQVRFESIPKVTFPKFIPTTRRVAFSIPLSMVVYSDGSVRDVNVSQEVVAEVAEQIFYDNARSKTKGPPTEVIRSELVQILTNQMKDAKFKPRVFNGEVLPTMVFVNSQFRVGDDSCPKIVSDFSSTGVLIWKGPTSLGCWVLSSPQV